jgi:uncharacterized membrane-anchored protein YjiN (DUF445 family)
LGQPRRIDRLARLSLLGALALAVLGQVLAQTHAAPFWGGLLFAFGEAALVGGLADWFAVRALFVHPFGIPFPHSALIPRNRHRITREIRELVQHEWLPRSLLKAKIEAFDFVGDGLLPVVAPLRPHMREVVRSLLCDLLDEMPAEDLAAFLARVVSGAVDRERIGPFLADLVGRARAHGWLEPLLYEWVKQLEAWAASPHSREAIRCHLEHAALVYRERDWVKRLTLHVAQAFGGVDLRAAAAALQSEIRRFAADQLADHSPIQQMVRDGLTSVEHRLREDQEFLADVRAFLLEKSASGALNALLRPLLESLRAEGRRELETPESVILNQVMKHLDGWLSALETDEDFRRRVNVWCRHLGGTLIEQHHSVLGVLVEEQLNRLSDDHLVGLIEAKVGEDLNWIRLNGTFVGGLVGLFLYLSFRVLSAGLAP